MNAIKSLFFGIIQLLLWGAFIAYIQDPAAHPAHLGVRPPDHFITMYPYISDIVYKWAGIIATPVQALFNLLTPGQNFTQDTVFPYMTANALNGFLNQLLSKYDLSSYINSFASPTLYPGTVIWALPVASGLYFALNKVLTPVWNKSYNFIWFLLTEHNLSRHKAKLYAKELERRTQDMDRLQNRVHTLAQEANSLKDSVITDELTKVYNKRFFLDRFEQEFLGCKQQRALFSFLMIDIDHFKRLNDSYGHLAGDEVLKQVASIMKRFSPDLCYPCRYGGEEFGVILPRKTVQEATEVARCIQEHVQKLRFPSIDPALRVTVSQGLCVVDFACPEAEAAKVHEDVMELADQQLYRSKENGRNRLSTAVLMSPPPQSKAQMG